MNNDMNKDITTIPDGMDYQAPASALVHIHEDLYVDAARVVSVQALGRDPEQDQTPGDEVAALWNLPCSPPHVRVVWSEHHEQCAAHIISCESMDDARELAHDIQERVNQGRFVVMHMGVDLAKGKDYTAVLHQLQKEIADARPPICPSCGVERGWPHLADCPTRKRVVHMIHHPGVSLCYHNGSNEGMTDVIANVTCERCNSLLKEQPVMRRESTPIMQDACESCGVPVGGIHAENCRRPGYRVGEGFTTKALLTDVAVACQKAVPDVPVRIDGCKCKSLLNGHEPGCPLG